MVATDVEVQTTFVTFVIVDELVVIVVTLVVVEIFLRVSEVVVVTVDVIDWSENTGGNA